MSNGMSKIPVDALMKNAGKISKSVLKNLNPLQVLHEYLDYKKTADAQETEREQISAKRDIAIRSIEAQREILLDYFDKRFTERKDALEKFFGVLETAVKDNNDKQLDIALTGILGIIKDNPLGDFEAFKKSMMMPDYTIEL